MANLAMEERLNNEVVYISTKDVETILSQYCDGNEVNELDNYSVNKASNNMLGYLGEYLKVKVHLKSQRVLYLFIKAVSKTNLAKAEMLKDMDLFGTETTFYLEIKKLLELPGIKPWSPRLIAVLEDAIVFEDLNAMQYKLKNKLERFDMAHTLQALKTLTRFHASCIIFEENKRKDMNSSYIINDDYRHVLHNGGYHMRNDWFVQCMKGSLEAMKVYSKYNEEEITIVECNWYNIWSTAANLSAFAPGETNVLCHRDLWNNNIMFHYSDEDEKDPDTCLFVDFQGVRYQPPASDVMVLLCCNLESKYRRENIMTFLDFYYNELKNILHNYDIDIQDIMTKKAFLKSIEQQTKWGLVVCACLLPQFYIDDTLTTTIFTDNVQFNEILSKNKGEFIKKMMANNTMYKKEVLEIFEEIADRYCFI